VARKLVEIFPIDTLDQLGDLWTKPLNEELFEKFTREVFGWSIQEAMAAHKASMGKGSVLILANPSVRPRITTQHQVTTMTPNVGLERESDRPGIQRGSPMVTFKARHGVLRSGTRYNLLLDMRRRRHQVRFQLDSSFRAREKGKKKRGRGHHVAKFKPAQESGSEWQRFLQKK
jgi:hypothetical protein